MKFKIAVLLQCILLCTSTVSAVNIEMVTVGNPGNAPDKRYNLGTHPEGYGAVNYVYQIGKYEITAGQYTEFLNAVAKADPNWLYNGNMFSSTYGAKIQQTGSSPNYSYSVAADWADRPVNYVSFWDAARFCNWLHNGQPTGPQGPGTTEDGAYHDIGKDALFGRNANAKFFIPTEDEWYKAAFHDKNAGLAATYFNFPTSTNAWPGPGNDITETTKPGNNANFRIGWFAIGSSYYRTIVGEFELSESPYGTFDQGGNVWEWDEVVSEPIPRRWRWRGGSFYEDIEYLHAAMRSYFLPATTESSAAGFRIAAAAPIPEPTSVALFSIAAVTLGGSRLRHR